MKHSDLIMSDHTSGFPHIYRVIEQHDCRHALSSTIKMRRVTHANSWHINLLAYAYSSSARQFSYMCARQFTHMCGRQFSHMCGRQFSHMCARQFSHMYSYVLLLWLLSPAPTSPVHRSHVYVSTKGKREQLWPDADQPAPTIKAEWTKHLHMYEFKWSRLNCIGVK